MMYIDTFGVSRTQCSVYVISQFECILLSQNLQLAVQTGTGFIYCGKVVSIQFFFSFSCSHLISEALWVRFLFCKVCLTTSAICLALSWGAHGILFCSLWIFATRNKMNLCLTWQFANCLMPATLKRCNPPFLFSQIRAINTSWHQHNAHFQTFPTLFLTKTLCVQLMQALVWILLLLKQEGGQALVHYRVSALSWWLYSVLCISKPNPSIAVKDWN